MDRMLTQVERLLDNPQFSDPRDPRFESVRKQQFQDAFREAVRLELVDRKGDWEPPTQEDVLKLAQDMLTNTTAPEPPPPMPVEGLDDEDLSAEPVVLWEVRVRGSSGYYQVVLDQWGDDEPLWRCTCAAFKYRKDPRVLCKHIISQIPMYEARKNAPEPEPEPEPPKPAPVPAPRKPQVVGPEKRNFRPPMMNIPVPSEGVMVDGSKPPPPHQTPPPADPWAAKPREKVVAVGARVTMGGKKKD